MRHEPDPVGSWAFLSDVHGNLPALEAALAACAALGARRYAFLGDLLGRGDSAGCVRRIRAVADLSVQGNRDLDWAPRVDEPTRDYVLGLPRLAGADDFLCAHGDARLQRPLDAADARRGGAKTYAWLRERGARLGYFGHTHQARVWRKRGPHAPLEDVTEDEVPLDGDAETVWLVNVGTVGMPFPGKDPPSCALYDGERIRILWFTGKRPRGLAASPRGFEDGQVRQPDL